METAFNLGQPSVGRAPKMGTVAITRLRYAHGRLTMRLHWIDLPARTALTAIGYELPVPRGAWAQPAALALFATVRGTGKRDISVPLTRTCAPTRVRIDVFLNSGQRLSATGPGVAPTC